MYKKFLSFYSNPLIEKFRDFFYKVYLKGLNNKDFIRESKNLNGASFDKFEEKIKSYHQKLTTTNEAPAKTPLGKESKNDPTMDYLDGLEDETPTQF